MEFECQYVRIPENKRKLNKKINDKKRILDFYKEQIENLRIGKEIKLNYSENEIEEKKENKNNIEQKKEKKED